MRVNGLPALAGHAFQLLPQSVQGLFGHQFLNSEKIKLVRHPSQGGIALLLTMPQALDIPGSKPELQGLEGQGMEKDRSEEHTSELQSRGHLVCRLLFEKNI